MKTQDAAAYIARKEKMSPRKIELLIYYIDGWSLAIHGKGLEGAEFISGPMGPEIEEKEKLVFGEGDGIISSQDIDLIEKVMGVYSHLSSKALGELSKIEPPYLEGWSVSAKERISKKTKESFYKIALHLGKVNFHVEVKDE